MLPCSLPTRSNALETPQLRALFLGDNDIHKPAERFETLAPVLAEKRIELVYTDDMRDINPAKLAGFDCLDTREGGTSASASSAAAVPKKTGSA